MAGEEGFEPSYAGIKIRCLTSLATPQLMLFIWPSHRADGGRGPAPRIRPCREASGIESHVLRLQCRTRRRRTLRNLSCAPAGIELSATRAALPPRGIAPSRPLRDRCARAPGKRAVL